MKPRSLSRAIGGEVDAQVPGAPRGGLRREPRTGWSEPKRHPRDQTRRGRCADTVYVPTKLLDLLTGAQHEVSCGAGGLTGRIAGPAVGPGHDLVDRLRCLVVVLAGSANADRRERLTRPEFAALVFGRVPDTATKVRSDQLLQELAATTCSCLGGPPEDRSEAAEFPILEPMDGSTSMERTQFFLRRRLNVRPRQRFQLLVSLLNRNFPDEVIPVFLPSYLGFASDVAAAIYLRLAGPASYSSAEAPYRISLRKLWEQTGLACPRFASVRRKLLTQGTHSALAQLGSARVGDGGWCLRVRLTLAEPTGDDELVTWACRGLRSP